MVGKMTCFIKCYKYEVLNLDTQYHTFKKKKKSRTAVYACSLTTRERVPRRILGAHRLASTAALVSSRLRDRSCLRKKTKTKVGE